MTAAGRAVVRIPPGRKLRLGLIIVAILVLATLAAGIISPHDPIRQDGRAQLEKPSFEHLLGTDSLGRDILSRLLYGARTSLTIAIGAVAFMVIIGVLVGAVAGYFGGIVDSALMRAADIVLAFPFALGAIAIISAIGPGAGNVLVTLALLGWPQMARITRAQVINEASKDYIAAVKVVGGSPFYILRRHLLPNAAGPIAVYGLMGLGSVILTESTLSFLGIGVQLPYPSWGSMLADAVGRLTVAPWLVYGPGMAVVLACLGFNLLGEGLDETFKAKTR